MAELLSISPFIPRAVREFHKGTGTGQSEQHWPAPDLRPRSSAGGHCPSGPAPGEDVVRTTSSLGPRFPGPPLTVAESAVWGQPATALLGYDRSIQRIDLRSTFEPVEPDQRRER